MAAADDNQDSDALPPPLDDTSGLAANMNATIAKEVVSNLSSEELELSPAEKAAIIQRRIRELKLQRDKECERRQERERIETQKHLLEVRRRMEENERSRAVQAQIREKEEAKRAEERQNQLLAREYKERFGREMDQEDLEEQRLAKMSNREKCKHYISLLHEEFKSASDDATREGISRCVETCRKYCSNLKLHPTDPKYHRINTNNKVFADRVGKYPAALKVLTSVGYTYSEEEPDVLVLQSIVPDGFVLAEAIKFLDVVIMLAQTKSM